MERPGTLVRKDAHETGADSDGPKRNRSSSRPAEEDGWYGSFGSRSIQWTSECAAPFGWILRGGRMLPRNVEDCPARMRSRIPSCEIESRNG
jgi:hypothetical protein